MKLLDFGLARAEAVGSIGESGLDTLSSPASPTHAGALVGTVGYFANLSADPEQEYFCDGMTEELIGGLSAARVFAVVSRSSVMTLKGTQKKARELASELGVRYLVEGSVRKAGSQIRVTAQLVDASRDVHLWSDRHSGTLDDVFDIQEKVARAVVAALELQLSPDADRRLSRRAIPDPVAYECYLKAHHEAWRFTRQGLDRAVELLDQALAILGPNVLVYAALGHVWFEYWNTGACMDEAMPMKAEEYAGKALALEPGCAQAHVVLGVLRGVSNPRLGIAHLETALAGNPDDPLSLEWLWYLQVSVGRFDAAVATLTRARRVDPLNPVLDYADASTEHLRGNFSTALERLRVSLLAHPDDFLLRHAYGLALAEEGDPRALTVLEDLAREQPGQGVAQIGLAMRHALAGDAEEAIKGLTPALLGWAKRDFSYSNLTAEVFALAGRPGEALDWLEHAVALGFINYPFLTRDRLLDSIRGTERFARLMERVKREWEAFDA